MGSYIKSFRENKKCVIGLVKKAKSVNVELGGYLEKHITIDDKNRTILYTGVETVISELMKSALVTD